MVDDREPGLGRRPFIGGATGLLGTLLADARPAGAQSTARRETLVVALDFSDTTTLDPGRVAGYSNPLPTRAAYDPLVTMAPGDNVTLRPCVATEWAYLPDGKTLRFKLRQDIKFVSGNKLTAEDVRFSFTRLLNMKFQASQYLAHLERVAVVDDYTVDFILRDPSQPILSILPAPEFGISEKAAVLAHGGTDVDTADKDTATAWLDQNSVGSGAFRLSGWQRNQSISLVRNPHYWNWAGAPGYERVLIRQMSESAAQLLALKRGDVDVAFNLIPEQVATLKDDPGIGIVRNQSLDYLYMAVGEHPDNPALQKAEARQAIGYAIDYDGIINSMMSGNATRPAAFLPVGVNGSTAETTKELGFSENLAKAKELLVKAGLPDGFSFKLNFANQALAGVAYRNVAQKLQSDLARVGIKVELEPMDMVSMFAAYNAARLQAVLAFWNPPAVENQLWASATVVRVARRLHWEVPPAFTQLVHDAAAERDTAKSAALWRQYQAQMRDFAHLFVLIQPVYQVAVRKSVVGLKITAAGWLAEFDSAKPA